MLSFDGAHWRVRRLGASTCLVVERGAVLDEQEGRIVLIVRDGAEQRRILLVVHVAERIVDGRAQIGPLSFHIKELRLCVTNGFVP